MIAQYLALSQRLGQEADGLAATTRVITQHWAQGETLPQYQDAFVNSVALNLHAFYAGVERLLEMIAVELDGGVLGGGAWHSELLRQMAVDLPGVRPAVLGRETMDALDEYRRFRHVIRNIYATRLEREPISRLVDGLPRVWALVHEDMARFQAFLQVLAHADEDEA